MSYSPSTSVCIPACNRPGLLKQAIESALDQTTLPSEIIIGDDSRDDSCEQAVAPILTTSKVPIVYKRNSPSLGQADNTNMLFEAASSETVVLLHDDDLLLPSALQDLSNCFREHPQLTAAYGKQYIFSEDGNIDLDASERLNRDYFRSEQWAGVQRSSAAAGVLQQFPNDCFMLRTSAARAVKWRPRAEVGNGCEYDFGLRLATSHNGFFFLNAFTAKYRLTTSQSMSNNPNDDAAMQSFLVLRAAEVPEDAAWAKEFQLKRLAPRAIAQLLRRGRNEEALEIILSKHYSFETRVHPRGIYQLMKALVGKARFHARRGVK